MAKAETTEVFPCTAKQFFDLVSDYEKYPEFLKEVKSCYIVEDKGSSKLVEFSVSLIKDFKYRLCLEDNGRDEINWNLDSGDIFKSQNGSWKIIDIGSNQCEVEYFVEATFGIFVPGPIAKTLLSVNLPNMMASYKKRVEELYG